MTTTETKQVAAPAAATEQQDNGRWQRLVNQEIPNEKRRIRELKNPTASQLQTEVYGTVLDLLHDLGRMALELGASTGQWLSNVTDHVEDVDARLSALEDVFSGDGTTQIAPDDAAKLLALAQGTKEMMRWLVENAAGLPEEAKQKFAEHAALAAACEEIINAGAADDEDDDEDEEAEPEDPAKKPS